METEPRAKVTSKFVNGSSTAPVCHECSQRVYHMEKIATDQHIYHKTCFRCSHCNRVLSLGSYATGAGGKPYCKPHFISLFKVKGNYEEGFSMTSEGIGSRSEMDKSSAVHRGDKSKENVECEGSGCEEEMQQRYFTMATAKSVFEHAPTSDTSPKLTKKASKWDKPKPVPPPAVNRDPENAEMSADPELPPPAYTKNMLAKFQSMQQSDGPLIGDSRVQSSKPKKLWEDELPTDKSSPSPQDDDDDVAYGGADDDANVPDDGTQEAATCMVSESEGPQVENGDADLRASVEDANEQVAGESESNKQECLISFDDDDAELVGPAADQDAAECDVEKREGDIPSDSPSEDLADGDAAASDDDVGVQESSTGEM